MPRDERGMVGGARVSSGIGNGLDSIGGSDRAGGCTDWDLFKDEGADGVCCGTAPGVPTLLEEDDAMRAIGD